MELWREDLLPEEKGQRPHRLVPKSIKEISPSLSVNHGMNRYRCYHGTGPTRKLHVSVQDNVEIRHTGVFIIHTTPKKQEHTKDHHNHCGKIAQIGKGVENERDHRSADDDSIVG